MNCHRCGPSIHTYICFMDTTDMDRNVQDILSNGVTVFPLLSEKQTKSYREAFINARARFPEFLHTPDAQQIPDVMGGFGAYGNPSSFHNGYIRHLRLATAPLMVDFFGRVARKMDVHNPLDAQETSPGGDWFLEHLFDRMCCRPKGSSVSAETAHRDLNPQTLVPTEEMIEVVQRRKGAEIRVPRQKHIPRPWDYCFGGWINLDSSEMQSFACVEGTHADQIAIVKKHGAESGFDTHEQLRGRVTHYDVPPSHAVVFFQRIQHVVSATKRKDADSYRQFWCYRLFRSVDASPAPLNGEEHWAETVRNFGVPRLPSAQMPPLYGSNHASLFLLKGTQADPVSWSARKVLPRLLLQKTVASGEKRGQTYRIAPRFMTSLRDYGLMDAYPPYEQFELQLLRPSRTWAMPTSMPDVENMRMHSHDDSRYSRDHLQVFHL